jgi:hypothetical protein
MMKKSLVLCMPVMFIGLAACGAGTASTTTGTISASSNGNCSPITTSQQCIITITYDTNGNSGQILGVSYSPQQLSQFTVPNPATSCPVPSSSGGSQTCQLQVTYLSNGSSVSENLTFTLGTANSNAILISGN